MWLFVCLYVVFVCVYIMCSCNVDTIRYVNKSYSFIVSRTLLTIACIMIDINFKRIISQF